MLDRRLDAGWDAAVVMLGNNYEGDAVAFGEALDDLLDQLAPLPVLLVNVTEFREDRVEVNYVITRRRRSHDNVRVLDWARRTRDAEHLLGADGLHLSDDGPDGRSRRHAPATASVARPFRPPRQLPRVDLLRRRLDDRPRPRDHDVVRARTHAGGEPADGSGNGGRRGWQP